jgi:ParB/RepB/Spo0J family partition protein
MGSDNARMAWIAVKSARLDGDGWDTYLTRYRVDGAALVESVRRSGVVEPVTVEEHGNGFRVISGFRRITAAGEAGVETVPAVVYTQDALEPREAYLAGLSANAPGVTLNDADRAAALLKARERFGFDEDGLISIIAPLVGLPASHKVVREYLAIAGLPDAVLGALARGEKSREHASALLQIAEADREWFFRDFVERMHLSASETRLVAAGALDLAARERKTLREVLVGLTAENETAGGAAQAKAALKGRIAERLAPILAEMESEFAGLASALDLPPGAAVEHSESFEGNAITLRAKAADAPTIARLAKALEKGVTDGTFEKMLSIARRKTDEVAAKLRKG